jgi:hypothetical protein
MKEHYVVHNPSGRVGKVIERDEDTHLVHPNDKKHLSQAERWDTKHVSSALKEHELPHWGGNK